MRNISIHEQYTSAKLNQFWWHFIWLETWSDLYIYKDQWGKSQPLQLQNVFVYTMETKFFVHKCPS